MIMKDLPALLSYTHTNLVNRMQKVTAALLLDESRLLLESLLLAPKAETLRVAVVGGTSTRFSCPQSLLTFFFLVTDDPPIPLPPHLSCPPLRW